MAAVYRIDSKLDANRLGAHGLGRDRSRCFIELYRSLIRVDKDRPVMPSATVSLVPWHSFSIRPSKQIIRL